MPTARPRYAITETPAITRALDRARVVWPEDSARPSRLLLRLIEAGEQVVSLDAERERKRMLRVIDEYAGSFSYPEGYLEDLRSEWPE